MKEELTPGGTGYQHILFEKNFATDGGNLDYQASLRNNGGALIRMT